MIDSQGITLSLTRRPVLVALLAMIVCATSIVAQTQCTQKLADLPESSELLGFHLGMTKDDVKARVPQTIFGKTDDFGVSKTTINPDFDPRIDKTKFEGVRSVSLDFLDGRLTSLWIGYDSTFKEQTIDGFVKMISQALHLPVAWPSWRSRGRQLHCADFQMTLTTVADAPSFRILDQAAEETIAARREAKEQQESAKEAAATEIPASNQEPAEVIGDRHTKTYYPPGCQAGKETTGENRVVFKSPEEAEKAGFKVARNCH
jgi:hypothetical protein